jgi:hypothetical protein
MSNADNDNVIPFPQDGRYTDEEITTFTTQQGCSVRDFKKRWIIQKDGSYFIHGKNGYLPPIKSIDLMVSAQRDLAQVPSPNKSEAGIQWDVPSGNGSKPKSTEAFLLDYSTAARHLNASMSIPRSYYDEKTQTFYERVCPLRALVPKYDEQVHTWLTYLGGPDAEKLFDWIATATDLSRVTCALYLHAGKDYGKTLFANGMARLWGEMPTELKSLASDFNSAILNSPLVFADEEMPEDVTSGFLRTTVGSTNRPLRRKGMPEAGLAGAVRLIIAANNETLLDNFKEDFTADDINAIAARILYIRCDPRAAEYLAELGGRSGTEGWLEGGDKIAAHALWLRDNRAVTPGSRFLVEGTIGPLHRRLATQGGTRSLVIEWICGALLTKWVEKDPGIRFGGGALYINASFVKTTWTKLTGDLRVPSLNRIGRSLRPISIGERRMKFDNRRADFYKINTEYVYDNAGSLQIGTVDDYKRLIDKPAAWLDLIDGEEPAPTTQTTMMSLFSTDPDLKNLPLAALIRRLSK